MEGKRPSRRVGLLGCGRKEQGHRLNEQEPTNIRKLHYAFISPIAQSSSSEGTYGPNGNGASHHNSLLTISCDNAGVCSLSSMDRSLVVAQ